MVEVQIYFIFFFSSPLFQALLKEHANDNPKLSYTGEPIVKWPSRVREHIFTANWEYIATDFCVL